MKRLVRVTTLVLVILGISGEFVSSQGGVSVAIVSPSTVQSGGKPYDVLVNVTNLGSSTTNVHHILSVNLDVAKNLALEFKEGTYFMQTQGNTVTIEWWVDLAPGQMTTGKVLYISGSTTYVSARLMSVMNDSLAVVANKNVSVVINAGTPTGVVTFLNSAGGKLAPGETGNWTIRFLAPYLAEFMWVNLTSSCPINDLPTGNAESSLRYETSLTLQLVAPSEATICNFGGTFYLKENPSKIFQITGRAEIGNTYKLFLPMIKK